MNKLFVPTLVTNHLEFPSESFTGNVFHEIEQNWFADVTVDDLNLD